MRIHYLRLAGEPDLLTSYTTESYRLFSVNAARDFGSFANCGKATKPVCRGRHSPPSAQSSDWCSASASIADVPRRERPTRHRDLRAAGPSPLSLGADESRLGRGDRDRRDPFSPPSPSRMGLRWPRHDDVRFWGHLLRRIDEVLPRVQS